MQKRSGGPDLEVSRLAYCVAFNSRKAARAVTRLYDSALAPVGVRSTQLAVLIALAKSQPLSIGSLAEILSVDTTTLTRSLRPIRQQGLLAISERSAMRQRFVTLTRKGTRALTDSTPLWRDVQTRFAKAIGEEHWKVLQRELARLSATARGLELGRSQRSKHQASRAGRGNSR